MLNRSVCFGLSMLGIFWLSPFLLKAQWLEGKVLDAGNQQPLVAAAVTTDSTRTDGTLTDAAGNFRLKYDGHASYIHITSIGYAPRTLSLNPGVKNIVIPMQASVLRLQDVVVLQSSHATGFASLAKMDLALQPVRSAQELLRVVPGLFVAQHAGGGKAEQIFLRGFDCDHGTDVAINLDGIPVNMVSHAHGQGYADAHFIIPETVQNIDFGAGPYYTRQGDLNTAGYVTYTTYDQLPGSRVQVEAGRFQTYRTLGLFTLDAAKNPQQQGYIAAEYYATNGPTIHPQHFHRYNIFGKYQGIITDKTHWGLTLTAFSSDWDASGQVPERAVKSGQIDRFGSIDPSEGGNTQRYNAQFRLDHRFNQHTLWNNQVYFTHYLFNLYSDFTFFLDDPVHGDEINQAEQRNIFGGRSELQTHRSLGNWGWNSLYGAGWRADATNGSRLSHVEKRQWLNDIQFGDIHESNAFGYLQEQFTHGRWLLEAGLRGDYLYFDYRDRLPAAPVRDPVGRSILSPKINLQYTLNKNVQLYLKTGKGFHSNDARVVTAGAGNEILPAAYGTDLGLILKPSPRLFINFTAWYLYLQSELVYAGDDGNVEASGRTQREGIDCIIRYQLNDHLFLNSNLNLTRPRYMDEPKGQNYVPLAPTMSSTGGIFYKAAKGWNGSITYRYLKSRPAIEDNSITAHGYFVTDAALNYTQHRYEIGLAIENLFNTQWNEAQFATTSRLYNEPLPVTELNFTPGTPFFAKLRFSVFF
ncbi:MAG TPA: TonB-dependent receptor plug domain-containing protein [Sediminibacterium sp.]|nr:TonB-dependent receptor plug domain-containing protein [Sediminibacterium sp.]